MRNAVASIDRCIDSVLTQYGRDEAYRLQYVIMDGASDDGTIDRIGHYEPDLHRFQSVHDDGPYDAVNRGIGFTDADVIGWINADDAYCPWALQTVASVFESLPDCDWLTTRMAASMSVGGQYVATGASIGFGINAIRRGFHRPDAGFGLGYVQQESTFFRRELWHKVGGLDHQRYDLAGDFELWLRMAKHALLDSVPVPLAMFCHRHDQRSADRRTYERQVLQAVRTHCDEPTRRFGMPPSDANERTKWRRLLRRVAGRPLWRDRIPVLNVVDARSQVVRWRRDWIEQCYY